MSSSGVLTSGVAGRYATALFEIAKDGGKVEKVEADLLAMEAALAESADLRDMVSSPVFNRSEMGAAIGAIAAKMEIGSEVANTMGLMAQNRRLFVLPGMIVAVKGMIAAERGEVIAQVTTAKPLSEAQTSALREALTEGAAGSVKLDITVDESLIGGLIVQVGSRMVDSSIRSKLANLQNVMKEVG